MKNKEQEKTPAIAEIKERVQFAEWQRQIEERQSEGLGVAAWCEQQGISKSTYYYRLRKVREHICRVAGSLSEAPPESSMEQQIVPIRMAANTVTEKRIEIVSGDLRISFTGETDISSLKAVVEALRSF